jgi:CYTH domain-containing protein
LKKIRYNIKTKEGVWEVDYFKDNGENYFCLAEFEMPENKKEPKTIPEIIKKHMLFKVSEFDKRFSSRKIADIKYAKKLLKFVKGRKK